MTVHGVRFALAILSVVGLVVTRAGGITAAQRRPDASEDLHALRHGGAERSYLLHVPARGAGQPRPLVIAFHGGGGNAAQFRREAGLDAVADREGFVVLYPNGTGPLRTALLTFNAGNNCCGSALRQQVDDVGFAGAAIEDAARRVRIDRRRVYATGHSNGGIMAYRLAAERADLVAAIVPVGGSMSLDRFAPSRPVPVLHIHSVDDPRALYAGGVGPPFPGTNSRVTHAAVQDGLDKWIARNGCRREPTVIRTLRGEPGSINAGQTATLVSHAPCSTGAVVEHWKLTGVGHGWPGAAPTTRERIIGPPTTLVNAAEEVWKFLAGR